MSQSVRARIQAYRLLLATFPTRDQFELGLTLSGADGKAIFDVIECERLEVQRKIAQLESEAEPTSRFGFNVLQFPVRG